MDKKIIGSVGCLIILLSIPAVMHTAVEATSMPTVINQDSQLVVLIFGSLRLVRLDSVGGAIANYGDTTAYDVCYTFTATGGFDDSIDVTHEDCMGDIPGVEHGTVHSIGLSYPRVVNGFGPTILTLTATSSNTDDVTEEAKGFQIGYFTLVFE